MPISSFVRSGLATARAVLTLGVIMAASACGAGGVATLHTANGDFAFSAEIADTDAAREKGLMFRTSLAPDAGMLFDFREERVTNFWMQNTLIPLDMVFVSADGTVRTIHANARPMDPETISSEVPVRFVLEIAGGRSAEIGLKVGDRMSNSRVRTQ